MQAEPTLPLRTARARAHESTLVLGAAIGVDSGALSRIERGLAGASPALLVRVAAHYDLSDADTVALLRWAAQVRPSRRRTPSDPGGRP